METRLTAVELYFLGKQLHAKYIDYAYIAAMDDIQENFNLKSKETLAELVKKGILEEDFSGKITINQGAERLLTPIFFGEKESSVDVCWLKEPKRVDIFKFHFFDDRITMVTGVEHELLVKEIDVSFFEPFVKELADKHKDINNTLTEIDSEKVLSFIAVKHVTLNSHSYVKTFINIEDVIYESSDEGLLKSVMKSGFVTQVVNVLRGETNGV